jgi:hypothetical protein
VTLKTTREIKMSEKHGILIKKTEATYLDVRNRINRGDASGRAKLGIDRSIHACVILFLVASVRKFGEEKIPKIRKGVTTENRETKKVNMKRREKEGKFIRGSKNTNTRRFRSFILCVP